MVLNAHHFHCRVHQSSTSAVIEIDVRHLDPAWKRLWVHSVVVVLVYKKKKEISKAAS